MSNQMEEMLKKFAALLDAKQPQRRSKSKKSKGKGRVASTPEEKAARMAANDAECIKVFKAAGYKVVEPRFNVRTYGRVKPDGTKTGWLAVGRMVNKGEKAHRVGRFNLFHEDQTSPIGVNPEPVQAEAQATVH